MYGILVLHDFFCIKKRGMHIKTNACFTGLIKLDQLHADEY